MRHAPGKAPEQTANDVGSQMRVLHSALEICDDSTIVTLKCNQIGKARQSFLSSAFVDVLSVACGLQMVIDGDASFSSRNPIQTIDPFPIAYDNAIGVIKEKKGESFDAAHFRETFDMIIWALINDNNSSIRLSLQSSDSPLLSDAVKVITETFESISVKFKNTETVVKSRIFSYTKEEEILFAALPVGTKNTVEDVYRKTLRSSGVTAKQSIAGVKEELSEIDLNAQNSFSAAISGLQLCVARLSQQTEKCTQNTINGTYDTAKLYARNIELIRTVQLTANLADPARRETVNDKIQFRNLLPYEKKMNRKLNDKIENFEYALKSSKNLISRPWENLNISCSIPNMKSRTGTQINDENKYRSKNENDHDNYNENENEEYLIMKTPGTVGHIPESDLNVDYKIDRANSHTPSHSSKLFFSPANISLPSPSPSKSNPTSTSTSSASFFLYSEVLSMTEKIRKCRRTLDLMNDSVSMLEVGKEYSDRKNAVNAVLNNSTRDDEYSESFEHDEFVRLKNNSDSNDDDTKGDQIRTPTSTVTSTVTTPIVATEKKKGKTTNFTAPDDDDEEDWILINEEHSSRNTFAPECSLLQLFDKLDLTLSSDTSNLKNKIQENENSGIKVLSPMAMIGLQNVNSGNSQNKYARDSALSKNASAPSYDLNLKIPNRGGGRERGRDRIGEEEEEENDGEYKKLDGSRIDSISVGERRGSERGRGGRGIRLYESFPMSPTANIGHILPIDSNDANTDDAKIKKMDLRRSVQLGDHKYQNSNENENETDILNSDGDTNDDNVNRNIIKQRNYLANERMKRKNVWNRMIAKTLISDVSISQVSPLRISANTENIEYWSHIKSHVNADFPVETHSNRNDKAADENNGVHSKKLSETAMFGGASNAFKNFHDKKENTKNENNKNENLTEILSRKSSIGNKEDVSSDDIPSSFSTLSSIPNSEPPSSSNLESEATTSEVQVTMNRFLFRRSNKESNSNSPFPASSIFSSTKNFDPPLTVAEKVDKPFSFPNTTKTDKNSVHSSVEKEEESKNSVGEKTIRKRKDDSVGDLKDEKEKEKEIIGAPAKTDSSVENKSETVKTDSTVLPTVVSTSTDDTTRTFSQQIYSFYEKYNPTKIHEIPKLLEKYKGQEQDLIRKLEKKYGVESGSSLFVENSKNNIVGGTDIKGAVQNNEEKNTIFSGIKSPGSIFSPSTTSGLNTAIQTPETITPLVVSTSTDDTTRTFSQQVHSFYEKYNPTKIHEIPKLLEKYKGQEQDLIRKLEKKYGATNFSSGFATPSAPFNNSDSTTPIDITKSGWGNNVFSSPTPTKGIGPGSGINLNSGPGSSPLSLFGTGGTGTSTPTPFAVPFTGPQSASHGQLLSSTNIAGNVSPYKGIGQGYCEGSASTFGSHGISGGISPSIFSPGITSPSGLFRGNVSLGETPTRPPSGLSTPFGTAPAGPGLGGVGINSGGTGLFTGQNTGGLFGGNQTPPRPLLGICGTTSVGGSTGYIPSITAMTPGVGVSGIASPFNAQNMNRGNRLFGQNTTINTPSIFGAPANTFTPGTGTGQTSIFGNNQSPGSFGTNTNTGFDNNFAKQVYSFYEKYNPTKIHEIPKLLEKYKGQEQDLIRKLEKKYGVASPVTNTFGQTTATFGQSAATPFGAQLPLGGVSGNSTPFGQQSTSTFGQINALAQFGQKPAQTPFGQTGATTFGLQSQTSSATPFGQTPSAFNHSPVSFGQSAITPTATFGQTTPSFGQAIPFGAQSNASPFGAQTNTSPFGVPSPVSTFGSQSSVTPFGAQSSLTPFGAQTNASPFGAQTNTSPFGVPSPLSSFGAQSSVTPFGAQPGATPFGVQTNASPFGTQSSVTPFGAQPGATPFGAQTNASPFGAQPGATPFGAQTNASPFGSQSNVTPFGAQSGATPFGAQTNASPFGSQSSVTPFGAQPGASPFGVPSPVNSFGSQSSVTPFGAQTNANPFGVPSPVSSFGSQPSVTPFGAQPGATPFGAQTNASPFGSQSSVTPFGAQTNASPFGVPSPVSSFGSSVTPFGSQSSVTPFGAQPSFGSVSGSTTPFGSSLPSAFGTQLGTAVQSGTSTPFGAGGHGGSTTPFGSQSGTTTPFGASLTAALGGGFRSTPSFGGTSLGVTSGFGSVTPSFGGQTMGSGTGTDLGLFGGATAGQQSTQQPLFGSTAVIGAQSGSTLFGVTRPASRW